MIYKWGGGEIMKIKVLEFMSNPLKISTFASSRVPSLTWKRYFHEDYNLYEQNK